MIVAHASAIGHTPIVVVATGIVIAHRWAWGRRPTRSIAPVAWAAAAGAAFLGVTSPPVEAVTNRSFTAHMAQHLVLWVAVPFLVLAARPLTTALRAGLVPDGVRRLFAPSVGGGRTIELVAGPIAVVSVVAVVWGTHLTGLYDLALRSPILHDLEHALYLATSVALWAAVLRGSAATRGRRIGFLVATAASMVLLAVVLSAGDAPLYETYVDALGTDGALVDQRAGAALMWVGSMLATGPAIVGSIWRWAHREHSAQLAREQAGTARI